MGRVIIFVMVIMLMVFNCAHNKTTKKNDNTCSHRCMVFENYDEYNECLEICTEMSNDNNE